MSKTFSAIYCGTPEFSVPTLEALIEDSVFDISLVITQPDRPTGRKQVLTPPPVKLAAQKHGIEVIQPEDINNVQITTYDFDFLIVVAYGQILSQDLLDLPSIAPINLHASLLPRWRGASPIQHAILAGDKETGVTIQHMIKELDTGPIIAQREVPIGPRDTTPILTDKLAKIGAKLLVETLKKPLESTPQDESKVTVCHKLTRNIGMVDPKTQTAEEIDRHVRALVPWPGVICKVHNTSIKLLETSLTEHPDAYPFSCAQDTTLYITKLLPPGRISMTGIEFGRRNS